MMRHERTRESWKGVTVVILAWFVLGGMDVMLFAWNWQATLVGHVVAVLIMLWRSLMSRWRSKRAKR